MARHRSLRQVPRPPVVALVVLAAVALIDTVNAHPGPPMLITTRNCQLYSRPDRSADSSPCRAFSYFYILPLNPTAKPYQSGGVPATHEGFYRVAAGQTEAEYKGWIQQSDAIEWHTGIALSFAPRHNRDRAHFFPDAESALSALRTGQFDAAVFREPKDSSVPMYMPVLETRVTSSGGIDGKLYRVAFAQQQSSGATRNADPVDKAGFLAKATSDVVFVLDTTASMRGVIAEIHKAMVGVVDQLARREPLLGRFRFGIVGFRDSEGTAGGDLEYTSRVLCTLEQGRDLDRFLETLGSIQVARVGSGDYCEDALAGITLAMDKKKMKWNQMAWKQIVVVTDSSIKGLDHPDPRCQTNAGGRTIAEVKSRVQPGTSTKSLLHAGFVIAAVLIDNALDPSDYRIARSQYAQLTTGRDYAGFVITGRSGEVAEALAQRMNVQFENLVNFVSAGGVANPAVRQPSISVQGSRERADDIAVHWDVYCTEHDSKGSRQFLPNMLVRKGQLESFNYMIRFIQARLEDAGPPGSKDVSTIVKNLQVISTSLNWPRPVTADTSVEELLSTLLGFSLKTRVFDRSIDQLARMSQADYDAWVKDVEECTDKLGRLIDNPGIWHKLHPTAQDREYHAFVPLADLP